MENTLYDAGIERKAGDWSCGSHPDTGGNINHLLWGEYKVYRVKICGQIELDIQ